MQPSPDPRSGTASGFTTAEDTSLVILNASEYTNDVGPDYEMQLEDKGAFSYEVNAASLSTHVVVIADIVLTLLLPILHSDTLYLVRQRRIKKNLS